MHLICLPYAGAASTIYHSWRFDEGVDISPIAVDYPGRGRRFREPLCSDLPSLVEILLRELAPVFEEPFAIYGHSIGGLVGFEMARQLQARNVANLKHLFLAAILPPRACRLDEGPALFQMSDRALIDHLRALGGMPTMALENPEFMALYLPIIRADCALADPKAWPSTYRLDTVPITLLCGTCDLTVRSAEMQRWNEVASNVRSTRYIDGGHLFLHENQVRLLRVLTDSLAGL